MNMLNCNLPSFCFFGIEMKLITSLPVCRSGSGSGVRCIISLANWSMFTLLDVETNTECGRTSDTFPPRNVFPGYRSVL